MGTFYELSWRIYLLNCLYYISDGPSKLTLYQYNMVLFFRNDTEFLTSKEEGQSAPKSPVRRMPLPYEVCMSMYLYINIYIFNSKHTRCLFCKILLTIPISFIFFFYSRLIDKLILHAMNKNSSSDCSVFSLYCKTIIMERHRRAHPRLHRHRLIQSSNLLMEPEVPRLLLNILMFSVQVTSYISKDKLDLYIFLFFFI